MQVLVDSQLQMINGSEWDSILKEDQDVQVSDLKEAMLHTGTLDKIKAASVNSVDEEDAGDITPAVEPTTESNSLVENPQTSTESKDKDKAEESDENRKKRTVLRERQSLFSLMKKLRLLIRILAYMSVLKINNFSMKRTH